MKEAPNSKIPGIASIQQCETGSCWENMSVSRAPKEEISGDNNMSVFNSVVGVCMAIVAMCGILLIVVNVREQGVVIDVNGREHEVGGGGGRGLAISGVFLLLTAIIAIWRLVRPRVASPPVAPILQGPSPAADIPDADKQHHDGELDLSEVEETPEPVAESTPIRSTNHESTPVGALRFKRVRYTYQKIYPEKKND